MCRSSTYTTSECLTDPLQSAYKAMHSTESALIKVTKYIISEMNSKRVVLMVLLDMSAAFDTVDNKILLSRLEKRFAVSGVALKWVASYLQGWSSQVNIGGHLSDPSVADFGVPQGSVLGPLKFTTYIAPVGEIARKHNINYHYADDTQLYTSFNPRVPGDREASLTTLNACICEIRSWMSANYLKLNDSKTEFFVAGSTHSLRLLPPLELTIGTLNIKPSDVIRNLGVSFNSTMSFSNHVNHLRQTINFQIRNLWRIRRFIDIDTSHHVARALITSRLDYCNALFTHLSSKDTTRLQIAL